MRLRKKLTVFPNVQVALGLHPQLVSERIHELALVEKNIYTQPDLLAKLAWISINSSIVRRNIKLRCFHKSLGGARAHL